jgi:hypothetical protein
MKTMEEQTTRRTIREIKTKMPGIENVISITDSYLGAAGITVSREIKAAMYLETPEYQVAIVQSHTEMNDSGILFGLFGKKVTKTPLLAIGYRLKVNEEWTKYELQDILLEDLQYKKIDATIEGSAKLEVILTDTSDRKHAHSFDIG